MRNGQINEVKQDIKNKSDVYRPTVRINNKTPTTFNELSINQIIKAKKEKEKTGRVKKFDLQGKYFFIYIIIF